VRRALPDRRLDMQKSLIEMAVGARRRAARSRPGTRRRRKMATAKKPKRIEAVNDFVVKFANVNGSGSARPTPERSSRAPSCAGRAGVAEEHLPLQHPGAADW